MRAQKIRRRLGGSSSLVEPFPQKPKGMRWRTYEHFREQAKAAEFSYASLALEDLQIPEERPLERT